MPFVRFADVNSHQRAFAFKLFVRHGALLRALKPVCQADSRNRKEQAGNHARADVGRSAQPFALFEHFCGFPAKTRKGGVAAKKSDGNRDAPVRRNDHAIQRELADKAKQKTSGEIDEQRSIWKRSAHANLHDALQAVPRERAGGAEQRNKENLQSLTFLRAAAPTKNSWRRAAARSHQSIEFSAGRLWRTPSPFNSEKECSVPESKMKAVADAAGNLARIVPVRSAERIGIVDLVARIAEILRGEIHIEVFAEGFSERKRKFRVTGKVPRAVAVQEAGAVAKPSGQEGVPRKRRVEPGAQRVALVVVEIAKTAAVAKLSRIGDESASDHAGALDHLVRVSQKDVEAILDSRRANGCFPAVNASALDRERQKDVGTAKRVMIEEVASVGLKVGEIERPAAHRNRKAEFALFVGFTMQRKKSGTGGIEQRA